MRYDPVDIIQDFFGNEHPINGHTVKYKTVAIAAADWNTATTPLVNNGVTYTYYYNIVIEGVSDTTYCDFEITSGTQESDMCIQSVDNILKIWTVEKQTTDLGIRAWYNAVTEIG